MSNPGCNVVSNDLVIDWTFSPSLIPLPEATDAKTSRLPKASASKRFQHVPAADMARSIKGNPTVSSKTIVGPSTPRAKGLLVKPKQQLKTTEEIGEDLKKDDEPKPR